MTRSYSGAEIHSMRIRTLNQDMAVAERLGISHRFMHMSALAPISRRDHAERHGQLFTGEEMLEWWALNDNSVDCRCAAVMVVLNKAGSPYDSNVIARARARLEQYLAVTK